MAAFKRVAIICSALAIATTSVSCGSSDGGEGGENSGGVSLPSSATKEEFQDAFADLDPIKLTVQVLGPKGSADGEKEAAYFEAISDWSGDKIEFEMNYSQSVAAGGEIDDAVSTGLLDIAVMIPSYDPTVYSAFDEVNGVSGVLSNDPVGSFLQAQAWWLAMAEEVPGFKQQFEDQGLEVLLAGYASAPHSIQCDEPRRTADQLKGVAARSSEAKVKSQLESVGANAANIPTAEAFEALQRGVVDCEVTSIRVSDNLGTLEEAPHVTTAPIGYNTASLVMNRDVWGKLPLVAQQLFRDRIDVYLNANFSLGWQAMANAVDTIEKAGGSIDPADDEVVASFTKVNADLLAKASGDVSGAAREQADLWLSKATELGFTATDWSGFTDWFANAQDSAPFVEAIMTEILAEDRPE